MEYQKQNSGCCGGRNVRDRFCEIDGKNVSGDSRKDDGQRDQQDHLAQQGDKKGDLRLTKAHKRCLAAHLYAEEPDTGHEDRHDAHHQGGQLFLACKDPGKNFRKLGDQQTFCQSERKCHDNGDLDRFAYPVEILGSEIITDDGLDPLGEALDRDEYQLHDALEYGHGTDIEIAAVPGKTGIENDVDSAFCKLHDKRGDPQGGDPPDQRKIGDQAYLSYIDHRLFRGQKPKHPGGA